MSLFDVIGPVMIGPSSSHTAGAVRLGLMARSILGRKAKNVEIQLHGSFAKTGKGHGTHLALLAGLMGWMPDDERIPKAKEYANKCGLKYEFKEVDLGELVHPNTVRFEFKGIKGQEREILGSSIGGGQVEITEIDSFPIVLTGKLPGVLVNQYDRPGVVALVSGILAKYNINIAMMRVFRTHKGGNAITMIECDQVVEPKIIEEIRALNNIEDAIFINSVV